MLNGQLEESNWEEYYSAAPSGEAISDRVHFSHVCLRAGQFTAA